jgi:arylsulfatase A-like enzyme/tetratricopeptide (TPR) repeat protein
MTRRGTIAVASAVVLVVAGIAALRGRSGAGRPASGGPNVLLVTIDTLRWDHVGVYGATGATTPVLDDLAARGVRFDTAIAHAPLTGPSHASILTGLTPIRHGVRDHGAFVLPASLPTLASTLRAAGYATAGFISGFPLERRFGFASGFQTYDDRLPRGQTPRDTAATERHADETTDRVIDWLNGRPQKPGAAPWFVWAHYFDPHAAYEPPPEYLRKFSARPYDGEIAFVDTQIGRLFSHLAGRGDLAGTVVLVTADHGESLGEHGEETHGVFIYDSTLRVPWIVAGPGVPAGRVASVVARGVDVMPTLLDLAGVPAPAAIDGRSLRPAVEGRSMSDEPAYIESLLAFRNFGWAPLRGVRDARWKYIDAPSPELYDLAADARESANRMPQQPGRARAMARVLATVVQAPTQDAAQPVAVDTANRLRALGYIGSPAAAPYGKETRDPKDRIALIARLEHAIADTPANPGRAVSELRAVLAEDEGIAVARRQLAVALSALGDHRQTIEQIRWLQAHGAATAEDLLLLSEALRVTGGGAEAADALRQAGRLDPRSPEIPLTEARRLVAERRPDEAARVYRRALDLAPDNPEALAGLGNLALAQGDVTAAGTMFERVLSSDPSDVEARRGLALVRGRQGRMAEALAMLQQVVRDAPADGQALAALGAALARTGSPGQAVPYFERAVNAGMRTTAVLNGLGFARLESGDREGALSALRASLSLEPQQPGVRQAVRDLSGGGSGPPVR